MKKFISGLVIGAMLVASSVIPVSAETAQTLFINEVMAANSTTIRDGDVDDEKGGSLGGGYSDWIELYNASSQPVNLSGYTISDDGGTYTFTQGTVPANGYILIWASGKDKVAQDGQIHTNFKLTSAGETITLKKPDGTIVDSVKFPALADDQSYSRTSDGAATFTTDAKPTPRSQNSTSVIVPGSGCKIAGYVKPDFNFTNDNIKAGFKVEVVETGKSATTDSNGYFVISDVAGGNYTLKISKNGYLARKINNLAVTGNVVVGSSSSPVDIWAGDISINGIQDEAINITDIMQVATSFNTIEGNAKYNTAVDINMNGAVNIEDIMIVVSHFNRATKDYPEFTSIVTSPIPSASTSPSPSPSVDPKDAWELNTGKINLGSTITYTGSGISVSGSTVRITSGGDHTVTGTLSNGMIYVDTTEKVKLRLSGASITNSNGPAIFFNDVDKGYITLVENTVNTLVDGKTYSDQSAKATLFSNDDLEIKGKGTLNITGNYNHAIASDDDIKIENGTINVISAVGDGIHANDSIKITGGKINITSTKDCIQTEDKELIIDGGTLTLSAGKKALLSDTEIIINSGTVTITKSEEGIQAPSITINGGTISVTSTDDCLNATTGGGTMWNDDGSLITINGGSIYLNGSTGDPLDSNGSLTITGGTTIVHGPQGAPEVAADINGTFAVLGGTLLITGPSSMMAQYPTGASSQYTIAAMFSSQAANSALCIKDSTGKALIITKPKRNYIYVVFSSPELKQGSTYTVYAGGTVSGGTEANGLITGATYTGGTAVATITVTTSPTTTYNWNGSGGFPGGGFPGGGFPGGGFPGWGGM
jgi:hypothetical protein